MPWRRGAGGTVKQADRVRKNVEIFILKPYISIDLA
jgi:hypothetical protein